MGLVNSGTVGDSERTGEAQCTSVNRDCPETGHLQSHVSAVSVQRRLQNDESTFSITSRL